MEGREGREVRSFPEHINERNEGGNSGRDVRRLLEQSR
jgi:hypothetical protein